VLSIVPTNKYVFIAGDRNTDCKPALLPCRLKTKLSKTVLRPTSTTIITWTSTKSNKDFLKPVTSQIITDFDAAINDRFGSEQQPSPPSTLGCIISTLLLSYLNAMQLKKKQAYVYILSLRPAFRFRFEFKPLTLKPEFYQSFDFMAS